MFLNLKSVGAVVFLIFPFLLFSQALLPEQHGGSKTRSLSLKGISHNYRYDFVKFNPDYAASSPVRRICASAEVEKKQNAFYAGESRESFEGWLKRTIADEKDLIAKDGVNYVIPVVVHVLYSSTRENIPKEQILSQIKVLNEDFNRKNKDTSLTSLQFRNVSTKVGITFRLATIDPEGKPTDGIDRISMSGSPFSENFITEVIKPNTIWDVNRYLNIWVCNIEKGVLGFSQFPRSSGLEGIPLDVGRINTDGVVINYVAFGTIGTVKAPFNKGRTATHEIGHWLGLRHTWGDGDCTASDFCEDTPSVEGPNFGCNYGKSGCKSLAMVENFMDYTNDSCMNTFTVNQKERIVSVLNNSPERKSLIASNRANEPALPPSPQFTADIRAGFEGVEIQYFDMTPGENSSRKWSFPGGTPTYSLEKNPKVIYSKAGNYHAALTVTNVYGADTRTADRFIYIYNKGVSLPFITDFETENEKQSPERKLILMGTGGAKWEETNTLGGYGNSSGSVYAGNYYNNKIGTKTWFYLPPLDFSSGESTQLAFDMAYQNFGKNYGDTLGVYISTDKGKSFHAIYYKYGQKLSEDTTHHLFYPQPEDWRTEVIDLSEYDGKTHIQIAFVNFNGYGNNLFLDNIKVSSAPLPLPEASFIADKREICVGEEVRIKDLSLHKPIRWKWAFPGAVVPADTVRNPVVSYAQPGVYDVILTVYNTSGGISSFQKGYITVKPAPEITVEGIQDTICPYSTLSLSAKGASQITWKYNDKTVKGNTLKDSLDFTTTFIVSGAGANGCKGNVSHTVFVKNDQGVLVAPASVSICSGEAITLNAKGGVSYLWQNENMKSSRTSAVIAEVPLKSTVYKVRILAESGCSFIRTVPVSVGEIPVVTIETDKKEICQGESVTLTGKGASAYYWSNGKTGKKIIETPAASGKIILRGISAFGCLDSTELLISVNAPPVLKTEPQKPVVCEGESIMLKASGAQSFFWQSEDKKEFSSQSFFSVSPEMSQLYTLTGKSDKGCSASLEIPVRVNKAQKVTLSANNYAVCKGETVVLKAKGGKQYIWKTDNGKTLNGDIISVFPEKMQTFRVSATDEAGCQMKKDSIVIRTIENKAPVADFVLNQEGAICSGQVVKFLEKTQNAKQYFWEFPGGEPATSSLPEPEVKYLKGGLYDVRLKVEGCEGVNEVVKKGVVIVTENPVVTLTPDKKTLCSGDSVLVTASSEGEVKKITWKTHSVSKRSGDNRLWMYPKDTGTLVVKTDFESGCSSTDSLSVPVFKNEEKLLLSEKQLFVCKGDSATLTALNGEKHLWKLSAESKSLPGNRIQFAPMKSGQVSVSAFTAQGCPVSEVVGVTVYPRPVVTVSPNMILLCKESSVTLTASGAGSFQWSPETGLSQFAGKSVEASPESTQTYAVTGTDENGCTASAFTTIGVSDVPSVSLKAENELICKGSVTRIQANGDGTFKWTPQSAIVETGNNYIIAAPEENTTFTVYATGEDGCESLAKVSITVQEAAPVEILPNTSVICSGDSILLEARTSYPVRWSEPVDIRLTASKQIMVSPSETTVYRLNGWDENGCLMTGMKTVIVKKNQTARITAPQSAVCEGGQITLEASGGKEYLWLPATGITTRRGAQAVVSPEANETYRVIVRDEEGCKDTASFAINARFFSPVVEVSQWEIDMANERGLVSFEDKTQGASQWSWDFGDGGKSDLKNPKHVFSSPGNYKVVLNVSNGVCEKTFSKTIKIFDSSDISVVEKNKSLKVSIDTENKLEFGFALPVDMTIRATVLSESREELISGNLPVKKGDNYHAIDLSSYPKGRFYLILTDHKGTTIEKVVGE
ncbi:MAG: PKD domain-containing protein [Bacteroidia bacterium]|nr:PKD domain-containing protein [Bacteroidia bacterium]